jgi:hypothetical protein
MKPHAAAARAILSYHNTGGEASLEGEITAEYDPLVKAAKRALVSVSGHENCEPTCWHHNLRTALKEVVCD